MKLALLTFIIFLAACATDGIYQFSQIREGMDKDRVLEILGSPLRTEKIAGTDKWSYRYFTGDDKETMNLKFIHFINGKVVNFGDDVEEQQRLEKIKEAALKKEKLRKKKIEVEEKVTNAFEKKPKTAEDTSAEEEKDGE